MHNRDGFTMTELLVVLTLAGAIAGMTIPSVGRMLARANSQRAASVVAADLKLAHSMAGRQRSPVRISVDTANRVMRVHDFLTPATIYSERHFGASSEYPVEQMRALPDTTVIVYPNGLASGAIEVRLRTRGGNRTVTLSRAGQVRVKAL